MVRTAGLATIAPKGAIGSGDGEAVDCVGLHLAWKDGVSRTSIGATYASMTQVSVANAEAGRNRKRAVRPRYPAPKYHLEAAIASVHATARGIDDTDWGKIVSLYDSLMMIRPSPIVALNRAIGIAQRDGPDRGIEEIDAITDADRLTSYPFYWAALGEFELRRKRWKPAQSHFRSALALARNEAERDFYTQRLHAAEEG
jgi:predicted RNA polymerase sigma factor